MIYSAQIMFEFWKDIPVSTGEEVRLRNAVPKSQAEMQEKIRREWEPAPSAVNSKNAGNKQITKIKCKRKKSQAS